MRPRGPISRLAGDVRAGVRRRQQERAPRVTLYDATGHARLIDAESEVHDRLVQTAEDLARVARVPDRDSARDPE